MFFKHASRAHFANSRKCLGDFYEIDEPTHGVARRSLKHLRKRERSSSNCCDESIDVVSKFGGSSKYLV